MIISEDIVLNRMENNPAIMRLHPSISYYVGGVSSVWRFWIKMKAIDNMVYLSVHAESLGSIAWLNSIDVDMFSLIS